MNDRSTVEDHLVKHCILTAADARPCMPAWQSMHVIIQSEAVFRSWMSYKLPTGYVEVQGLFLADCFHCSCMHWCMMGCTL